MIPKSVSEMEIIENPKEWLVNYQGGWLAHYNETGKTDWGKYAHPRNKLAPAGAGVRLAESRLMLISSAGGYLRGSQLPFKDNDPLGDYSIRVIPTTAPLAAIGFAQSHYDHQHVDEDPEVLVPLRHLEALVREGVIGGVAPSMVSFSGYQPNVIRVVKEVVPAVLEVARREQVDAALLIPASMLCIQSAGLIARALEVNCIATVLTSWDASPVELTAPPRATTTRLESGRTLGKANDRAQQRRVLEATLALLEMDAPLDPVALDEGVS